LPDLRRFFMMSSPGKPGLDAIHVLPAARDDVDPATSAGMTM
jgi:hypothetical protein